MNEIYEMLKHINDGVKLRCKVSLEYTESEVLRFVIDVKTPRTKDVGRVVRYTRIVTRFECVGLSPEDMLCLVETMTNDINEFIDNHSGDKQ